jgi:hypothetical protein
MDTLPEELRKNMMINSILLLKKKNGWGKVHYNIKKSSLYLKKTHYNKYISNDMMYETILRANTVVYFVWGKTFTWLKKAPPNSCNINIKDIYYYKPNYMI